MSKTVERWTPAQIRAMLALYRHTDHARFSSRKEEADYYATVLGRQVPTVTLWRIDSQGWYQLDANGEIVKGPNWEAKRKPEPKEEPEQLWIWEKEPEGPSLREILDEMAGHMEELDRLSAKLREIVERRETNE